LLITDGNSCRKKPQKAIFIIAVIK